MQGCLSIEIETAHEPRHALPIDPAMPALAAPAIERAEFLLHIDSCVRHLAAMLAGSESTPSDGEAPTVERRRVQLWHWLHGGGAFLDDGTPIDFALFDEAIQRAGERLPKRGLPGQENLLQAACLLAELTHARTLAESALVSARKP